jgi:hypothetical protein
VASSPAEKRGLVQGGMQGGKEEKGIRATSLGDLLCLYCPVPSNHPCPPPLRPLTPQPVRPRTFPATQKAETPRIPSVSFPPSAPPPRPGEGSGQEARVVGPTPGRLGTWTADSGKEGGKGYTALPPSLPPPPPPSPPPASLPLLLLPPPAPASLPLPPPSPRPPPPVEPVRAGEARAALPPPLPRGAGSALGWSRGPERLGTGGREGRREGGREGGREGKRAAGTEVCWRKGGRRGAG